MIKIFHCGDIHLDTPFSHALPGDGAKKRLRLREKFLGMLSLARAEKVSLVLIPGDLFDGVGVQNATVEAALAAFEELGCPVVICPGNHDPYTPDSIFASARLPGNVHVFREEALARLDLDAIGVSVFGYAFTSQSHESAPLAGFDRSMLSEKNINILCAHTDLYSASSKYAPITEKELEGSGFTYAALAHIHNEPEIMRFGSTVAAYSGFAMGRGFDECGYGGAWLITVDTSPSDGALVVTPERVCITDPAFEVETVDISGAKSDAEAAAIVKQALSSREYGEDTSVRILLTGEIPMTYTPSLTSLTRLCDVASSVEVRDKTAVELDTDTLAADPGIKGELYRTLLPQINDPDPEKKRLALTALKYALCAMTGQDITVE